MKRYNFDQVPRMAQGFAVHANSKKAAWTKAYRLAKKNGYFGKLEFRDNMKCPKRNEYDIKRGRFCPKCWNELK